MIWLLATSLIWAFSFGLIGNTLQGVDPYFLAAARLALSALVFAPLLRVRRIPARTALAFAGVGAVQYGLMYIALFLSYRHLRSHEVAFFTVFTPIYVTLLNDGLERRFHPRFLGTALLAVVGTAIVKYGELRSERFWAGFLLMQASNLCFAFGQVAYRRVRRRHPAEPDHAGFGLLYAGALVVAAAGWAGPGGAGAPALSGRQALIILYLGVVASGLAFFLWNLGATRVNAGALAVFNNLKIPLAVAVSLLVFGERTDLPKLFLGGGLCLVALALNEALARSASATACTGRNLGHIAAGARGPEGRSAGRNGSWRH